MTCKYYDIILDVCGLCDLRSDFFSEDANPSNQHNADCLDPEYELCTAYEEES